MNIVLIGMPGAGKSTLGVLLAKALGMDFIDTDILIQQQENRLLQDIIDNDGIEEFIRIEEATVSALQAENSVIATGGSVIFSKKAINLLKQGGQLFYLQVPYAEIERRLKNVESRGIVIKAGSNLKDVYSERIPLYSEYADKIVDCTDKNVEDCVKAIIAVKRNYTII